MMAEVLERQECSTARWKATIYYRSDDLGIVDVEHGFEEIQDLHDLVERGPDWNTIERIVVVLDRRSCADLTLEQASSQ